MGKAGSNGNHGSYQKAEGDVTGGTVSGGGVNGFGVNGGSVNGVGVSGGGMEGMTTRSTTEDHDEVIGKDLYLPLFSYILLYSPLYTYFPR